MKLSPAQQTTLRQIILQPGPQRVALWHWSTLVSLYRRGLVVLWLPGRINGCEPQHTNIWDRRRYRVEVSSSGRDEASRLRAAQGVA